VTLASFLSSGTQHAILNGLAFFAFVLWLSLGYWTYKDAKRRIEDPLLIGMAVLLALVIPYLGPFVYMLFRPPEYLEDVRERELEV
jgi:4-amino-4-deoxy-L-arabinose transferase-like glycosyltransferase